MRGMWYVTDGFARVETDFPVYECNFQNRGRYAAIIILGNIIPGEERPEEIHLEPGEVKKNIPSAGIRHIWFRSEQRITKIYYLLKGRQNG